MVFVQYLHRQGDKLVEALGDRAVVILDGRNSLSTMHADAVRFNGFRRPEYDAYRIYRGESFTRSQPISGIIPLAKVVGGAS